MDLSPDSDLGRERTPTTTITTTSSLESGDQEIPAAKTKQKQQKLRPFSACIPCRNRKVKCDRLTPCETCATRGLAQECCYVANEVDRRAMAQADTIGDLRRVVRNLRLRAEDGTASSSSSSVTTATTGSSGSRMHPQSRGMGEYAGAGADVEGDAMVTVYEALRVLGEDDALGLVGMIRDGASMRDVAVLAREYLYRARCGFDV